MNKIALEDLQEVIGYKFHDDALLLRAISHSSYANERVINKAQNYERLEFLGDAVLELVSSEYLYHKYPDLAEGQLTKTRASMVCEPSLAFCAKKIKLEEYILLGKGEERTGGREKESIMCDVVEAIIGAVYLDSGFDTAKDLIYRLVLNEIDEKAIFFDAKTRLQEITQKILHCAPTYELIQETGPDHQRTFQVQVKIADEVYATASGNNKKTAQQNAALATIEMLQSKTGKKLTKSK